MKSRTSFLYYLLLILISIGFTLYQALTYRFHVNVHAPNIHGGTLILKSEDLKDQKLIPLKGEVMFYWMEVIDSATPAIENIPFNFITIPGVWNGTKINRRPIEGHGFATYRFSIIVPDNKMYCIKIKEFESSYRLIANNIVFESGRFDTARQGVVPSWKRNEIFIQPVNNTITVYLQVSNFHHRKGGAEDVMLFGYAEQVIAYKYENISTEMFISGLILLTILLYLGLYIFIPSDRISLTFALFLTGIGTRMLLTGEKQLLDFFPHLSWFVAVRIEYVTIALPTFLGVILIHQLFPFFFKRWIHRINILLFALFAFSLLGLPVKYFTFLPMVYQPVIWLSLLYILYILIRAVKVKETGALFLLTGVTFIVLTGGNELLFYNKLLYTGYLLPTSSLVIIFSFTYSISVRFAYSIHEMKNLRLALSKSNEQLEEIVNARTAELVIKTEELEEFADKVRQTNSKLKELIEYRDTMTGLIIHDMKALLAPVLGLNETSSKDYIRLTHHSGTILFNMVLNILELQKQEDANLDLDITENSISDMVDEVLKQLSYPVKSKNLTVAVNISAGLKVNCDEHLISRVFLNMLHNAIKYSARDQIIQIVAEKEINFVTFKIIDKGIGIPKGYHQKIFEKYGQVTTSADKKVSTGLGLAFCQMAVKKHLGKIGVKSEIGKGSTFWFILPDNLTATN